jgi:hypothetical protein
MSTFAQQLEIPEVEASIGLGMEDGKIAVMVTVNETVLYWSAQTARKTGYQWVGEGVRAVSSLGGVSVLQLKFEDFETLITPEGLIQAGLDLLAAAHVLMGIGVAHNWLEKAHGFGIDAQAVCDSVQPKEPAVEEPESPPS